MDQYARANRDVPRDLVRELTRYGGLNPHGRPVWRVVLAQNVFEQSFGVMRYMPLVTADSDGLDEIEPEKVEAGEFWTPKYDLRGWILERWFPPRVWGDVFEWEQATGEDGVTRMMGEYPRHGDWNMVSDEAYPHLLSIDRWKSLIQMELRAQSLLPGDPALHLSNSLYRKRVQQQAREDQFEREVDAIHKGITEPAFATVGRTAQLVRNGLAESMGYEGNLAAG